MFYFKIERYILIQTVIAACLNLGELINGYGVAWSSPVLPKFEDMNQSPLPYKISETQQSWMVSIVYFGCIGAYLGGYLSNRIGRKKSLLVGGFLNLFSYLILSLANNLSMVYIGRFFAGLSMSCLSVVGLIYIGEIASSNIRGIILTSMGVFHALGGLLVYSVGPFVNYAAVGYVNLGLTVIYMVFCCFLPESPMYYVLKDDENSARATLEFLGRSEDINIELRTMIEKVRNEKNSKHIWIELFSTKCNRRSLFITVFLSFFQQASGILVVIFYATAIFKHAGSSIKPEIATIIVGATFVFGTIGAPMCIEKYGRRVLLMVSFVGLLVMMALLGLFFYMKLTRFESVKDLGWLPLLLLILAIFSYSVGLTIIPNTLSGELFTSKVRGLGPSISLCSGWISGFLSTTTFGFVVVALGIHVTFWIFAVCNVFGLLFVIFFVPETMGMTLMEIQDMLDK